MESLANSFQEGGFPMYGVLCLAMSGNPVGLAALIVAFVSKRRSVLLGTGAAALAFGVATLVIGIGGYFYSMTIVDSAIAMADAASREALRARGQAEAMNAVYFGGLASALPIGAGVLALLRGLVQPSGELRTT